MGVFDAHPAVLKRLCLFECELRFRDRVMGGVPRDPKMIEGWLRKSAIGGDGQEERRLALLRTALDVGLPVDQSMSYDDLMGLASKLASETHTQGFRRDQRGLYIESRTVKAALKESINIALPYSVQKFGPTRKAGKSYLSEHLFIWPSRLHLGITEPDSIDLAIGHVTGPQGPRSTLGYHEAARRRSLSFHVLCQDIDFDDATWAIIWTTAQAQGLGARRSAGHGVFEVTRWEEKGQPTAGLVERIYAEDAQQLSDDPLDDIGDPFAFAAERILEPMRE